MKMMTIKLRYARFSLSLYARLAAKALAHEFGGNVESNNTYQRSTRHTRSRSSMKL